MDNKIDATQNLSMSAISAMSHVREEKEQPKNYINKLILLVMVIAVFILVGMSVINFGSFVVKQDAKVINAKNNHNQDVQKLTNQ